MKPEKLISVSPRDRILATAIRLFNLKGIRATGVDTLIKESDVAKMTFYKYFPTKQSLVSEYLKNRDVLILSRIKLEFDSPSKSPSEKLLSIFDVLTELFNDPMFRGCVFINAIVEARDPLSPDHLLASEHKRVFHSLLKKVAADENLKQPQLIADRLFLLFQGAVISALIENSAHPIKVAKEIAVKCLH